MLNVLSVAYVQPERKEKILKNESVTECYKLLWQNWFLFNNVVKVTELMVSFILYKLWTGAKQIIYVTPFTASLFLMPIWIWWSVNKAYIIIYHVIIVTLFLSTIGNFRFSSSELFLLPHLCWWGKSASPPAAELVGSILACFLTCGEQHCDLLRKQDLSHPEQTSRLQALGLRYLGRVFFYPHLAV